MLMPKWLQSVYILFDIIVKLRGVVDVVDSLKGDEVIFRYAFHVGRHNMVGMFSQCPESSIQGTVYTLPHFMLDADKSEGEVFPIFDNVVVVRTNPAIHSAGVFV